MCLCVVTLCGHICGSVCLAIWSYSTHYSDFAQAFFADIYGEARKAKPGLGHKALAQIANAHKLVRHYTMNIDGLAEAAGMDTWHVDNNPTGRSTTSQTHKPALHFWTNPSPPPPPPPLPPALSPHPVPVLLPCPWVLVCCLTALSCVPPIPCVLPCPVALSSFACPMALPFVPL